MEATVEATRYQALVEGFVTFLTTGAAPAGLLQPDVFVDLTTPLWRQQVQGAEELVAVRKLSHPALGTVPRWRSDPTATGFVLEFEEQWEDEGGTWYSREMARADVVDGAISHLSIYCTGDWDPALLERHRREVALLRP